jgi:hypothetical protein
MVSGAQAAPFGSVPTVSAIGTSVYGVDLQIHPSGGSSGYQGLVYGIETADPSDDWTIIWAGAPDNVSSNGQLCYRGSDSAGGWNLALRYTGGDTIAADYVSAAPVQYTASLTGLSLSLGRHERVALMKSGTSLSVFDWRTRRTASTSGASSVLRASTQGIALGLVSGTTAAGHNRPNTVLAFSAALPPGAIWDLLENPWQVFRGRRRILAPSAAASFFYNPMSGRGGSAAQPLVTH